MHTFLVKKPRFGLDIDHRNRNKLDNRTKNLRIVTRSRNVFNSWLQKNNSTGHRGVFYEKKNESKPWLAKIGVRKKQVYLGNFKTKKEAISAYTQAAKRYYGRDANPEIMRRRIK